MYGMKANAQSASYKFARFRIDFTGLPRQYDKYVQLRNTLKELTHHMRAAGQIYEAAELTYWMESGDGFTRQHMPYWVQLPKQEYDTLMAAVRQHMPEQYSRIRYYGKWV